MRIEKMRKTFSLFVVATMLFALLAAPQIASAFSVKQMFTRISSVAGETLVTGNVVAIKAADGLEWKADADVSTLRPAIGIIGKGGTAGEKVEVVIWAIVTGWTSLTKGAPGYLSETPGLITQSSPSWSQQLGVAINGTDYLVSFHNYFNTTGITALGTLTGATPIVLEGATPDDYETTIAVTDSTADRTITLPDASGTVNVNCTSSHNYGGAAVAWTMTAAEAACPFISVTNANGAVNAVLPAAEPGKFWFILNGSGQILTFKVTGQTGGTIASGKYALYAGNAADVFEIYEQP